MDYMISENSLGSGPEALHTDRVDFATLPDDLAELIPTMTERSQTRLEQRLDEIQEQTLDELYSLLQEAGITLQERLVIAMDAEGRLHVGEHPQAPIVSRILDTHIWIANSLRSMAALSLVIRGADNLAMAGQILHGQMHGDRLLFQACLKGGLSHFHLLGPS